MPFVGDGNRHIAESGYVMGNEFPFITVASGGAFHKLSVLIDKLCGQTVQLQHEQGSMAFQESSQFADHFCLIQREQWGRMVI
jgi:hypothetical protein